MTEQLEVSVDRIMRQWVSISAEDGAPICEFTDFALDTQRQIERAHLFAAAPQMLEALREAADKLHVIGIHLRGMSSPTAQKDAEAAFRAIKVIDAAIVRAKP